MQPGWPMYRNEVDVILELPTIGCQYEIMFSY